MDDLEEDVDIEGEFSIERDKFTAESVNREPVSDVNGWLNQTLGNDIDSDSKQAILALLKSDEAANGVPPSLVMGLAKTTEAMKKTSRRQMWSDKDKALFESGVEIYDKSWKDIAELLPNKTISQVTSYGIQYFKKKREERRLTNKQHSPAKSSLSSADHPLLSKAVVQVVEECDLDLDVDIMSDWEDGESPNGPLSDSVSVSLPEPSSMEYSDKMLGRNLDGETRVSNAEAMKKTRRRQMWSDEDKALFETGVEIYGKSWKDIAELLPNKTISQVTSYGIQYFKRRKKGKGNSPVKRRQSHTELSTSSATLSSNLDGQGCPLTSQSSVHLIEDCEDDEDVDIMSDGEKIGAPVLEDATHKISSMPSQNKANSTVLTNGSGTTHQNCTSHSSPSCEEVVTELPKIGAVEVQTPVDSVISSGCDRFAVDTKGDDINGECRSPDQTTRGRTTDNPAERSDHEKLAEAKSNGEEIVSSDRGVKDYYTPVQCRLDYGVLNSDGELVPMPAPEIETTVERDAISQQEKDVHFEFFQNRSNKTPERYLRIRNYIIDQWQSVKPKYLNKTSIRTGLRQCGDVNCIGRIHAYLEQLGAINFGCAQAVYQRMAMSGRPPARPAQDQTPLNVQRSRKRKPTAKRYQGNGATYEHGSDEELFVPPSKESRSDNSHSAHLDSYALISCADFGSFGDMKCPYHVILESSAAAMMDIHSHLCKTEVIGLLGGKFNKEDDSLRVVRAEPCWSKSTSLHCDMDPVSQTQAGEMIQQAGLQVIGWYHSHPTFIANPSQQDIESQEIFQKWFSQGGNHFLGVIISPYNSANQTASSEIRCFTTATLRGSKSIPFKFDFKVETSANNNELVDLVPKASKLLDMYKHYQHTVDLLDTYRSSSELSSLEKMLLSVASYLQTADVRHIDKNLILEDLRFVLTAYCEKAD